jgi:hypothetical protein
VVKPVGFYRVSSFLWLIQYFEKILSKSRKRPLFLYSAIRRSFCFTPPMITIAMTPTITVAVPRSFAAERMEYQFMVAMLPHDFRLIRWRYHPGAR